MSSKLDKLLAQGYQVKDLKILIYDIETTPLLAYIWQCGDQTVRHGQLAKSRNMYDIITIQYKWVGDKDVTILDWGYEEQDSAVMVRKFDAVIKEADIIIGKNNHRFDDKRLNTRRWINNDAGMANWQDKSDDLEKMVRKYLALPSYSLDYISQYLGLGGKIKMEFDDWIHIVEKTPDLGPKAFDKMVKYGGKDVQDTEYILLYTLKHVVPKYNMSAHMQGMCCKVCGGTDLKKNGYHISGKTRYLNWFCKTHNGYAGKSIAKSDSKCQDVMG